MGSQWSQVRLFTKLVSAVLAFTAGVALAGHEAGLWRFSPRGEFYLAAVGITLVFLASVASAVQQWRSANAEVTLRNVQQGATHALNALLFRIQDETGIDMRDLGATVHLRTRTGLWPRRRERLVPVARVRFRATSASGIVWRPGVGVIGCCVELGKLLVMDVAALDRRLEGTSAAEWEELRSKERPDPGGQALTLGMSYREWQRAKGKFSVVLATPLLGRSSTGSKVLGCVSVDIMTPDPNPDSYSLLSGEAVRFAAGAAANEISNVLVASS
ncbi:hypothetical protein NI17_005285 [Thermobifida halotolerans]|uniref:Uncharacterized protein n=1 Tax=Thermobifida halotolerans TaxID=483545 RepID=A0A399G6Y8_9ACTN|nr:hypothetical protein [Thermobifida halotolerans]UOE20630.1 hypothetical protein NI17_005285 [Thermobifida halotolerans]